VVLEDLAPLKRSSIALLAKLRIALISRMGMLVARMQCRKLIQASSASE
jgi:hypothetical protein